jgi:hypothetical protein
VLLGTLPAPLHAQPMAKHLQSLPSKILALLKQMQLHGQHWVVPLLVQQRETPLLFLEQLLLLLDIHLVRLHALLMEVRLQLLLQPNVLQLLVTQDTAMLVIRPLYPLWLQTKVVPTKTGGLMAMDQNHWNSAELLALLPVIRTLMLLARIVTVDVVQMMKPSATVIRSTAATTSTAQV